jgi:hypothetical protein
MSTNIPDKPQFWYKPHSEEHSGVRPLMPEDPPLRPVIEQLHPVMEPLPEVSEPPLPLRTELTVLQADETKDRTLNWVVQEYSGVELHPIIDGLPGPYPVPMTEDLVVGRDYTAIGLFSEHLKWTVGKDSYGEFTISCGTSLIGCLQRGGDDRNCWVVTGMINTRGLEKLVKTTEG